MELQSVEELMKNLTHSNKLKRRSALDKLTNELFNSNRVPAFEELKNIFNNVETQLISTLLDESEVNRSKTCKLIIKFLENGIRVPKLPDYVIPSLHNQIGTSTLKEMCEENRLEFIILIETMMDVYGSELHLHLNDLCSIFTARLTDDYPEVIIECCDCIWKLQNIQHTKFQMFSSYFLHPILKSLSKHRLKVRVKCISALECIYVYGDDRDFTENNKILRNYILDIPQVRIAILSYGYKLALKMKERYSFWHIILPFILFGLRDENKEIQELAKSYWDEIGMQYEAENEDVRILSKKFGTHFEEARVHIKNPPTLCFNRGSCALIEKAFHLMLPTISSELDDWQVDVRLGAMKLLTVSVVGLRSNVLQYSTKILSLLHHAVIDQDPRIINEALFCSECLGNFLSPELYLPLLQPYLSTNSEAAFNIFSSLVKSTPDYLISKSITEFMGTLGFTSFKDGPPQEIHYEILRIMERLFYSSQISSFDANFAFTLFYITGLQNQSSSDINHEYLVQILELCAKSHGFDSFTDFVTSNLKVCLEKINETTFWLEETNSELCVFIFLSSAREFPLYINDVGSILQKKINSETSPLVIFKVLQALQRMIEDTELLLGDVAVKLKWISFSLKELIPQYTSRYSRSVRSSFRTALLSFLNSTLSCSPGENEEFYENLKNHLEFVLSQMCEDVVESRILVCSFIGAFAEKFKKFLQDDTFYNFMKVLSDRMNDREVKVRQTALRSLAICARLLPEFSPNDDKIKAIMKDLAVFTLEDDKLFVGNIAGLLKIFGQFYPDYLKSINDDHANSIENLIQNVEDIKM